MLHSHLRSRPQGSQSGRLGKTLLGRLGSELFWKSYETEELFPPRRFLAFLSPVLSRLICEHVFACV